MTVTAIVFSCILFCIALILLFYRMAGAPCASFLGLLIMSFAKTSEGYPLLPISNNMIFGWLCITVLVTVVTLLQPREVMAMRRGIGYIAGGAIVGLALGLLGFTFIGNINALYAIMSVAVAAGTFFGYLIFTNTPSGKGVNVSSGNFYRYFLAKGFPTAITIMQAGAVLVLIEVMKIYQTL